jgi:hypothetical protein
MTQPQPRAGEAKTRHWFFFDTESNARTPVATGEGCALNPGGGRRR